MSESAIFLFVILGYLFIAICILSLIWALDAFIFGLTGRSFLSALADKLLPH